MLNDELLAVSPIDGRYKKKTSSLRTHFSEAALISFRIKIELLYLQQLSEYKIYSPLSDSEKTFLSKLAEADEQAILRVKVIEKETHHDVKAVEYYLREQFVANKLDRLVPFIHFAITSEDINNLAYRLMIQGGLKQVVIPSIIQVLTELSKLSREYAALPMLARTHGQAAIPTTFGKELAVFVERILYVLAELKDFKLHAKFSGAVGGYQAMHFAYQEIDWPKFSRELVNDLDFDLVEVATQICPADDLVKLFSIFHRLSGILLDLNQDIWRYISDAWLLQKGKEQFVGSSTMPQKINPIEFENSEGNLVMANALLEGLMRKLPVSRLQRDLSESTVLRNIGSVFAHCLLAYTSLSGALAKLVVNPEAINQALHANYNILSEAMQTLARKNGDKEAYEKIAKLAKNKVITQGDWQALTANLDKQLQNLKPSNYIGLSAQLALEAVARVEQFLKDNPQLQTT